ANDNVSQHTDKDMLTEVSVPVPHGSLVHLQLVQVHPGLCEFGSNKDENWTLIQEQQQLVEKLKECTKLWWHL
uniref:Uncharacterized protein n=1 Tax=Monopterus albus TaxID=43700 RepID=A0A3Q3QNP8_MONAL